ncbi:MAG: hypothetical protein DRH26_07965 [Deltaproteobacteria bacterium]|nr:MAG: hypothetical protein DRH26_07965 [Deltaproteobacteria bacterium]
MHSRVTIRHYKKALMTVCLCIVVFAGGSAFSGPAGNDMSQKLCENGFECFDDFIVYLKNAHEPVDNDEHGTEKEDGILICNVVVELNQGMMLSKDRVELRKIIYKTLKELSGLNKIRSELKEATKEAIKIRLNNSMDSEIIKKVYLIKFVLL